MILTDIKYYHSGGVVNNNPENDLGGIQSNIELGSSIDNLFDDLSGSVSRVGRTDYRCFYIKNTHATHVLRNAKVYIWSEKESGSLLDLGATLENAHQNVIISGPNPPNEGDFFELYVIRRYSGPQDAYVRAYYHPNPTIWQGRFQTELRSIDSCQDARVDFYGSIGNPTNITFTVNFTGSLGSRLLDSMVVRGTTQLSTCSASVVVTRSGNPMNTTAITISNKTTAPANVDFSHPLYGSPFKIGDLRPYDAIPIWVRRTTPANTTAKILDNIKIHIDGDFP